MFSLDAIGRKFGSDKFTRHNFGPIYDRLFKDMRLHAKKVLEIGIGGEGYEDGGHSLFAWQEYFPSAEIIGIDIFPKSNVHGERIKTVVCDQTDLNALAEFARKYGPFDIIIDDGTHKSDDAVKSLETLFEYLQPGGVFVIEDIQTSYWSAYGGSSIAPDWFNTNIKWLKNCVDTINASEFTNRKMAEEAGKLRISELHVFHNLAAIVKTETDQIRCSNVLDKDMTSNLSNDDEFYNAEIAELYLNYRNSPTVFKEIIAETRVQKSSKLEVDNVERIRKSRVEVLQDTIDSNKSYIEVIEGLKAHLEAANADQNLYILDLELIKTKLESSLKDHSNSIQDYEASVRTYTNYIKEVENSMSRLEAVNADQQGYIQELEKEKSRLEGSLADHSRSIVDYELSTRTYVTYISGLESRLIKFTSPQ